MPSGKPLQDSWGDVLPPSAVNGCAMGAPSVTSVLVTSNAGTAGSREYGSGAVGRVRSTVHLLEAIFVTLGPGPHGGRRRTCRAAVLAG